MKYVAPLMRAGYYAPFAVTSTRLNGETWYLRTNLRWLQSQIKPAPLQRQIVNLVLNNILAGESPHPAASEVARCLSPPHNLANGLWACSLM
jgi:hypothetical protein